MVVDASVAVRWVVSQPGSEMAEQVVRSRERLVAPELILAEAGNALWKYVRAGLVRPDIAEQAISRVAGPFDALVSLPPLAEQAMRIAMELDHAIYDCFYLALADVHDTAVLTADKRLLNKTRRTRFARRVAALADYRA